MSAKNRVYEDDPSAVARTSNGHAKTSKEVPLHHIPACLTGTPNLFGAVVRTADAVIDDATLATLAEGIAPSELSDREIEDIATNGKADEAIADAGAAFDEAAVSYVALCKRVSTTTLGPAAAADHAATVTWNLRHLMKPFVFRRSGLIDLRSLNGVLALTSLITCLVGFVLVLKFEFDNVGNAFMDLNPDLVDSLWDAQKQAAVAIIFPIFFLKFLECHSTRTYVRTQRGLVCVGLVLLFVIPVIWPLTSLLVGPDSEYAEIFFEVFLYPRYWQLFISISGLCILNHLLLKGAYMFGVLPLFKQTSCEDAPDYRFADRRLAVRQREEFALAGLREQVKEISKPKAVATAKKAYLARVRTRIRNKSAELASLRASFNFRNRG